jgi:hypothetical protein
LNQLPFLNAVFRVVEYITKAELTNSGKRLIISYINDSREASLAERARQAIIRYTQSHIPSFEESRKQAEAGSIDTLGRLLLELHGVTSALR